VRIVGRASDGGGASSRVHTLPRLDVLGWSIVEHVSVSGSDGVVVLTVDRPPANALDIELMRDVVEAVERVAADLPGALVLAGREGFFSAGADLKAVPSYGQAEQRQMVQGINAMALGIYGLRCPVIGAITGHAIAGGLVLALCTDLRVASSAGRYGLTEIKVGVPYPQAAIGVVRAELAPHSARVLALGNQLIDAGECLRLGVFDEVVESDTVLPRALELARELASFPADTYARTKRELRGQTLEGLLAAAADDPLLTKVG
jgi:enoyl-CoA hydratase